MDSRGRSLWSAAVMVCAGTKVNFIVDVIDLLCLFSRRQGGKQMFCYSCLTGCTLKKMSKKNFNYKGSFKYTTVKFTLLRQIEHDSK